MAIAGTRRLLVSGPHAAALAGSFGFLAGNTVAGLLIARWLGPAGRGEVSYAFLLISLASTVAYFGIDYCATHLLAHEKTRSPATVRALFGSALATGGAAGIAAIAIAGVVRPAVAPGAILLGIIAFTVVRVAAAATFAIGKPKVVAVVRVGAGCAYLGTTLVALVREQQAAPVVWAWSTSAVLMSGVLFGVVHRAAPSREPVDRTAFARLLRLGRATWQSSLAQLVTYRLDQLVVLGVLGAAALGRYSLAAFVMSLLWVVADSVGEIEHPTGALLDDWERVRRLRSVGVRVTSVVAVLAVVVVAMSPFAVPVVVGAGYDDLPVLLALLAPGTVALSAGKVAGAALLASGRTSTLRKATLTAALCAAVGTFPAVRFGGVRGAAAFASVVYAFLGYRLWAAATTTDLPERT